MREEEKFRFLFLSLQLRCSCLFVTTRGQFHQCSMHSFYIRKFCTQFFCAYVLGLYFIGARLLAQKLHIECWWNRTKVYNIMCIIDFEESNSFSLNLWYTLTTVKVREGTRCTPCILQIKTIFNLIWLFNFSLRQFFLLILLPQKYCLWQKWSQESWSQSYQTLISDFCYYFWFLLLSLAISKYRQYFLMLKTLKLNNEKQKKSSFYEEKSLVGLIPGTNFFLFDLI
jgi:hypothetical protein